jgi:hypothetical protein
MKSLEELADKWRLDEFGTCAKCQVRLKYADKFVDVAEGICGSSQGHPCAYIDTAKRYHVVCYKQC